MPHELELKDVTSPWDGQYDITLVLRIISSYLEIKSDCFLMGDFGELHSVRKAAISYNNGSKIQVTNIKDDKYIIDNWPKDKDFESFRQQAQSLLEKITLSRQPEYYI
ncbi:hypothetical protein CMI47_22230 [Candidatus Pacearchaeota archaeon]|nr:hypothetical protein [Candidatus Pacearchaeota archaeon]|tara:strand:+ start:18120 stop:18443 length:324 start_codon:yes stop_codon:yes gene_type:complete